jgi:glycerate kinase
MATALGLAWTECETTDALGRPIRGRYAINTTSGVAAMEMSEASGLWRLNPAERNPMQASTFGTGLMIADALRRGASTVYVGIGGSATNDAGAGMAAAMGIRFLDATGKEVTPVPSRFLEIATVELPSKSPDGNTRIVAACDVGNPLLGPQGASRVYGPQKGATADTVERLEDALRHFANCTEAATGRNRREYPGSGAAGGLGFGLMTFLGAEVTSGFALVAEASGLERAVANADLILTAEGRLDSQTLSGKGPAELARMAAKHGVPVVGIGGGVTEEAEASELFDAVFPLPDGPMTLADAMLRAGELLKRASARVARLWTAAEAKCPRPSHEG